MSFTPTHIVFDFDGTLSVPTLDFALMRRRSMAVLSNWSPSPVSTDLPVMEELARVCALLAPADAAAARAATLEVVVEVEVEAARRSRLFSFVRPMLAMFRQKGLTGGIVTRNCPEAVRTVFPDVDEHFACLVTRQDVQRVKPHPEHLLKAMSLMGAEAGNTLMVGDHPMDVIVGKRAGTHTAGVTSGEAPRGLLEAESPDYLAGDAGELMHMLGLM